MNIVVIKHRLWPILTLLIVVAFVTGCVPPTPPPTPAPTETVQPRQTAFYCDPPKNDLEPVATGSHYILNQVILTGSANDVEKLVANLQGTQGIELNLIQTCHLDNRPLPESAAAPNKDAADAEAQPTSAPQFRPEQRATLVMALYGFPDPSSTPDPKYTIKVIAAINKVSGEYGVFVDPNYLTGPLAISPCATEGDPFEVGGSPFEVGGSSAAPPGPGATRNAYVNQWAFENIGLGSFERRAVDQTGKGTVVAVFDTSPYAPGDQPTFDLQDVQPNIMLSFPPFSVELPPVPISGTMPSNVADHGLFVSGLVYAIATQSEIHLIRVLNDFGCGDLFTLNKAVGEFVAGMTKDSSDRLDNVVLNFSLGVQWPTDADQSNWPEDVVSLDETLRNAYDRGAVIVASAGNDSNESSGPLKSQLPAGLPYVIGVAATGPKGERACYSNEGDVAAPGADGMPIGKSACEPASQDCDPNDPDCTWGVVSLATQPPTDPKATPTGFRFWVGTSFAAPLVSGQAALLRESMLNERPLDVANRIYCSATSPIPEGVTHGQVNVPDSLSPCRVPSQ